MNFKKIGIFFWVVFFHITVSNFSFAQNCGLQQWNIDWAHLLSNPLNINSQQKSLKIEYIPLLDVFVVAGSYSDLNVSFIPVLGGLNSDGALMYISDLGNSGQLFPFYHRFGDITSGLPVGYIQSDSTQSVFDVDVVDDASVLVLGLHSESGNINTNPFNYYPIDHRINIPTGATQSVVERVSLNGIGGVWNNNTEAFQDVTSFYKAKKVLIAPDTTVTVVGDFKGTERWGTPSTIIDPWAIGTYSTPITSLNNSTDINVTTFNTNRTLVCQLNWGTLGEDHVLGSAINPLDASEMTVVGQVDCANGVSINGVNTVCSGSAGYVLKVDRTNCTITEGQLFDSSMDDKIQFVGYLPNGHLIIGGQVGSDIAFDFTNLSNMTPISHPTSFWAKYSPSNSLEMLRILDFPGASDTALDAFTFRGSQSNITFSGHITFPGGYAFSLLNEINSTDGSYFTIDPLVFPSQFQITSMVSKDDSVAATVEDINQSTAGTWIDIKFSPVCVGP